MRSSSSDCMPRTDGCMPKGSELIQAQTRTGFSADAHWFQRRRALVQAQTRTGFSVTVSSSDTAYVLGEHGAGRRLAIPADLCRVAPDPHRRVDPDRSTRLLLAEPAWQPTAHRIRQQAPVGPADAARASSSWDR